MLRKLFCTKVFTPLGVCAGVLCAGMYLAPAPPAGADPTGGEQSAQAVINRLEDQGYNVQLNWVSGASTEPLSSCRATAVHNPDRSSPPAPKSSITVYVDVSCPNEPDDGVWGGIGIGFG
ncbi:hypothetical protein M2272_001242 [Mycobacterium frederiksbergense]|uniref:PASTA domain-containing protein n=1 Tax=Mycolicibacterium frederiksbergense TaxID=117567 RepID=A0ABT6KVI5_9MYCO|nr:hypothetical protein [Mycolicibacterium frederiksbergense]MDH6194613.1 hypothetical protein [Mycolicibacterium frederiksbergense]